MDWEKSPLEKCSTRCQTLLGQCNEHRFVFFWIPNLEFFFRRRQASPVPPRLQVQPWEDKGETWPLQLVQVETNLNAISVWRESVRVGLIFFLEKKWPLRASLPDWFEPWDPSGPIFQKVLNFRWEHHNKSATKKLKRQARPPISDQINISTTHDKAQSVVWRRRVKGHLCLRHFLPLPGFDCHGRQVRKALKIIIHTGLYPWQPFKHFTNSKVLRFSEN